MIKTTRRFALVVGLTLISTSLMGAIGPTVRSFDPNVKSTTPISIAADWVTCVDDPATADNSGSTIINPSLITRSTQHYVLTGGYGTTLQIRLVYPTAATGTGNPVVQPFGFDRNNAPERLLDSSANHAQTLTIDTTNDARDGTNSYTQPVEVDANANSTVLIGVKTAMTGTGITGSKVQVRMK